MDLHGAFSTASNQGAQAGHFQLHFNATTGKIMTDAADKKDDLRDTPAASAFTALQPAPKGGLLNNAEISKDEMSDELFAAVRAGNVTRARELMRDGADINRPEPNGTTLLMVAVTEQQKDIAQDLLARKDLRLDGQDDLGMTALMLASTNGNIELAKLLLDAMASTELMNMEGDTADDIARARGNFALAELIVQKQRQRQAVEDAYQHKAHKIAEREAEAEGRALRAIFGGEREPEKVDLFAASSPSEEAPVTLMGRMSKFFGISKFFGNSAENAPAPNAAPGLSAGTQVLNFIKKFSPGV
ncbi:MAG: ankyrin repeat domain-containing protein [Micavibrio sp.]|nr:ankyrin repeat domain-containing protein [Micavibrio sp.]